MTDKEMLELAAKAMGLNLKHAWNQERDEKGILARVAHKKDGSLLSTGWDPLNDDADAFRVAVHLELDVMHRVVGGRRVEILPPGGPVTKEFYDSNPRSATRRAIVRAAASIGETK